MALLDIIIPHRSEAWAEGRKMFEMLRLQRGVTDGDFSVILVQDGEDDDTLDLPRILRVYPFVESVLTIPRSGVSAARNAGLEFSEAPWVMFCDFDDAFSEIDGLRRFTGAIRKAGDRADLIWSDFWMEGTDRAGCWAKRAKGWNNVFIHAKAWRREWLIEKNIRFSEELSYSEDAMFCATAAMELDPKRVLHIGAAPYMWCYRQESASNYTGGDARRNLSLYRKRVMVCEEYEKRGNAYEANAAAGRALIDYWRETGGGTRELAGGTADDWERRIRQDILRRWPDPFGVITAEDRKLLEAAALQEAELKGLLREGIPEFDEWLRRIREAGPQREGKSE